MKNENINIKSSFDMVSIGRMTRVVLVGSCMDLSLKPSCFDQVHTSVKPSSFWSFSFIFLWLFKTSMASIVIRSSKSSSSTSKYLLCFVSASNPCSQGQSSAHYGNAFNSVSGPWWRSMATFTRTYVSPHKRLCTLRCSMLDLIEL